MIQTKKANLNTPVSGHFFNISVSYLALVYKKVSLWMISQQALFPYL